MTHEMEFLLKYGYMVLFAVVLAEQIGLPVPSAPFLLAAGALAGLRRLNVFETLAWAVVASLIGDCLWFYLGQRRGGSLLSLLSRISTESAACASKTRSLYLHYGPRSLLIAKFIPGLSTVAPPMAGMFKLPLWKFMTLDSAGALLWAGSFTAAGWLLRGQLEILAVSLGRLGAGLGIGLAFGLALYVGEKYIRQRRIYRTQRIARLAPIELKG